MGRPYSLSASSTVCTARSTPAQYPRGLASRTRLVTAQHYAVPVTEPDNGRSTPERPWPVRVVSQKIGAWIGKLGWVWVDGQLAQITRRPGTQVVFLTLRDPSADLSLTVTAHRDVLDLGAPNLSEGARVVLHAKPEFFPARGTLSLRADEIRQVGLGELLARIERLKKLLAAEGLFDPRRKRRPPFLPRRIGLVTGRASAAERDVLTNARRRWPAVQCRVINVAVQGSGAVPQMIDALAVLDKDPDTDVIILARGGGSVEDLLPFSDEALGRAVPRAPPGRRRRGAEPHAGPAARALPRRHASAGVCDRAAPRRRRGPRARSGDEG